MNNDTLVDQVLANANATPAEREIAERLLAAMAELDQMTSALTALEQAHGTDA